MALETINMVDPNGNTVEVPASSQEVYERQGWTVASDQDANAADQSGSGVREDQPQVLGEPGGRNAPPVGPNTGQPVQ